MDVLSEIDTDIYSNTTKIVKKDVKVNKVNMVQISAQITGRRSWKSIGKRVRGKWHWRRQIRLYNNRLFRGESGKNNNREKDRLSFVLIQCDR